MSEKPEEPETRECDLCDGYGRIEVTREMAIDAGNMSMAGIYIQCGQCDGTGRTR